MAQAAAFASRPRTSWDTDPQGTYAKIKGLYEQETALSSAQTEECARILQELATFLAPFIEVTSDHVLANSEFYRSTEKLKQLEPMQTIWNNKKFQVCLAVAYGINEEIAPNPGATIDLDRAIDWAKEYRGSVQIIDRNGANAVINHLSTCIKANRKSQAIPTPDLQKCQNIYRSLPQYLERIGYLLDHYLFNEKGDDFFDPLFGAISKITLPDQEAMNTKVRKLYFASHPASQTPHNSPVASAAPAYTRSPHSPTSRALDPELRKAAAVGNGSTGAAPPPPPSTEQTPLLQPAPLPKPIAQPKEEEPGCCILV